jgi:hypothetical protein
MRRITTDRIYDGGPIILYYNAVTVLHLPAILITVTCTGL